LIIDRRFESDMTKWQEWRHFTHKRSNMDQHVLPRLSISARCAKTDWLIVLLTSNL